MGIEGIGHLSGDDESFEDDDLAPDADDPGDDLQPGVEELETTDELVPDQVDQPDPDE